MQCMSIVFKAQDKSQIDALCIVRISHCKLHAYTDGQELPISLLWVDNTLFLQNLRINTLAELDHVSCGAQLSLSAQDFISNGNQMYPSSFQWRGEMQLLYVLALRVYITSITESVLT